MNRRNKSAIDREMNQALKTARLPAERLAIQREAQDRRRRELLPTVKETIHPIDLSPEICFQMAIDIERLARDTMIQSLMVPAGLFAAPSRHSAPMFVSFEPARPAMLAIDRARLDSLKQTEPRKVLRPAPDMVTVITGWRAWGVETRDGGYRLKALGKSTPWEPRKQMDAACVKDGYFEAGTMHPAPQLDCSCGIWAFKDLDRLLAAIRLHINVRVIGTVSLWGRVVETENGYRAQHAYPSELWLLDPSLEELGYIYDVPVRM